MGASANLTAPAVAVAPGEEATTELRVRNNGAIVDQIVLDVLGDAAAFTTIEPSVLNLFPGAEGTATIRFSPPRASKTPAGMVAYGVRVWSREDPEGSTVEEGQLDLGGFIDTTAELMPRTSRGRRQGRHELAVDNRGNQTLQATVSVVDPDDLITARVEPATLVVPPGTAVFQQVVVRPRRRFLRGQSKTIPFQVIVSGEGQPPVAADGAMVQEQVLPRWLLPAALIALAALVAAFVLWQTLLKPKIESAARDAADEQTQDVADQAEAAQEAAEAAQQSAATAAEAAAGGGGAPAPAPSPAPGGGLGPVNAPAGSAPVDFRLTGPFDPSDSFESPGSATFDVPDGQTLQITDIVFQNPGADTGRLRVLRDDTVLFEIGLANFRDYDYHFVTPLEFTADQDVAISVQCVSGGTPGTACTPAASFTGFTEPAA
jgi:hypothetical protein